VQQWKQSRLSRSLRSKDNLIPAILALGVLLQLLRYGNGRSLWFDEVLLALNVIHRPLGQLLHPLDYHQAAPFGFLALQKLATAIGGKSELALRAAPLGAALVSLILFLNVARLYLSAQAVPVAVALFALNPSLIHYSSEAKQYVFDVAMTLLLLWVVGTPDTFLRRRRDVIVLSLVGAAAVWFSYPAIFVLAGIAATLVLRVYTDKTQGMPRKLALVLVTWAISSTICYFLSLTSVRADQALLNFWRNSLPTHPLLSFSNLRWIGLSFVRMFEETAGLTDFLGLTLFCAGCMGLVRRDRLLCSLLVVPIPVALAAAFVGGYPFGGRLLLFLVPLVLLVIAEGVAWIASHCGRFQTAALVGLLAALLAQPVAADVQEVTHPRRPEDIKLAIRHIQSHQLPGDVWFIYHYARFQYWYYAELYGLSPAVVRIGRDCGTDTACYAADLNQLQGEPRVWILFSHIWLGDGLQEEDFTIQQLSTMGKCLDKFSQSGVRAYLYDLR
jgi:hypothetical protein